MTPEALDYLQVPGLQQGTIDQEIYSAAITGDLGSIRHPDADGLREHQGGVRRRAPHRSTEQRDRRSDLAVPPVRHGRSDHRTSGSTKVLDLFTEMRVPLVQDAPFADQLGLELAYRYSDYDTLTTDTYKVGLDWAPVQDIRFRGSYQRAVRAANVVELFTAQGFNLFDLPGDPCGAELSARTAKQQGRLSCEWRPADVRRPARRARLDSPAGQYNFLQGGNLDLCRRSRTRTPTA